MISSNYNNKITSLFVLNLSQKKNNKKKIGICSILCWIRIHYPGSGSADPDPHQNEADPKHWRIEPVV